MSAIKLYRHPLSGHAHRVELLLSLLGLETELIDVDLLKGEHKQPAFLKKNSAGQVPVIEDGDVTLSDSNAILIYLASKYDDAHTWLPIEPVIAAQVQGFLTIAASSVAYGPATARLITIFHAKFDHQIALDIAHAMLKQLDPHLEHHPWLVGHQPTIADIANYTYIAHAPEGGVSLQDYPHVRRWLSRVEELKGFVPMQVTAVGLVV